ncbi:DUF4439 domain-containing protein [Nocardioides anomalus]|uniref:DUF4439 domain-containing protein n=1 Tax=Nocardioides anomalus TaxID=2712223 RepID=A0A6G6WB95_9ACTN|nr:DUF4439 domain-containing protein [Nocardioides anomalus]QIG42423.1 DUF4439 domain-containing protein [Nocardioides anomalus]
MGLRPARLADLADGRGGPLHRPARGVRRPPRAPRHPHRRDRGPGRHPQPAAPAYTPPPGLDTTDGRYAAALALEQACAETYAALVGETTGERRVEAIGLLDDAAVRALSFRGTPETFPGADEYADR